MKNVISIVALALLLNLGSAWADRYEEATETVPAGDFESVEVSIDFGAGRLDVGPSDSDEPVKLDVYYSPRYVDYELDYDVRGDVCRVYLESDIRGRHLDDNDVENEWTVALSKKYPVELDMDIGACEGVFDLGGIPLRALNLDVGAADLEFDFPTRNPIRMEELSVDCGASSLVIEGLANANVEYLTFDVGAGSCELDFRGDFEGESEVSLDVGMGSIEVDLPRGLAIQVRGDDGWFSSLDFEGMDLVKRRGGVWESEDFDEADNRIFFDVDISMGSVTFTVQ